MTLREMLSDFVAKERSLLQTPRGGMSVGDHPSIVPSVLKQLEWMLKHSDDSEQDR